MSVVANPLVVRIFINSTLTGQENGWAERWPIWEENWNDALAVALLMVQARQRILSSNAYIQWACLGTVAPPYYEQTVVTDALYPLPQWGQAAFDMQGILFDLNTTSGENAPRLIKAVEADQVHDKRWIYWNMPIPWEIPILPADLATSPKDLLWQNSLATFRRYSSTQQPMADGHHGPGDGYWVDSFQQIVYRQMSSRRWGRPWKRMSWEAAPYADAPQFSPCGSVVTVNRISYVIPCRFGQDWSLRWIHYYESQPGATVMTFKTPFCCWARSLEYDDFDGVGEARKFRKRDWTSGASYGGAPGTIWTGPSSYFLGYAPEPAMPTPAFMLPACDEPPTPTPAPRDPSRALARIPRGMTPAWLLLRSGTLPRRMAPPAVPTVPAGRPQRMLPPPVPRPDRRPMASRTLALAPWIPSYLAGRPHPVLRAAPQPSRKPMANRGALAVLPPLPPRVLASRPIAQVPGPGDLGRRDGPVKAGRVNSLVPLVPARALASGPVVKVISKPRKIIVSKVADILFSPPTVGSYPTLSTPSLGGSNGYCGTASASSPMPSGLAPSDCLYVAAIMVQAGVSITPPAGWTQVNDVTQGNQHVVTYYQNSASPITGDVWTFGSSTQFNATIAWFTNVLGRTPTGGTVTQGNSSAPASTTISTWESHALAICYAICGPTWIDAPPAIPPWTDLGSPCLQPLTGNLHMAGLDKNPSGLVDATMIPFGIGTADWIDIVEIYT